MTGKTKKIEHRIKKGNKIEKISFPIIEYQSYCEEAKRLFSISFRLPSRVLPEQRDVKFSTSSKLKKKRN